MREKKTRKVGALKGWLINTKKAKGLTYKEMEEITGVNSRTIHQLVSRNKSVSKNIYKTIKTSGVFENIELNPDGTIKVRLSLCKKSMSLIHELENDYGQLGNVPEDNKKLYKLRKMVGVR